MPSPPHLRAQRPPLPLKSRGAEKRATCVVQVRVVRKTWVRTAAYAFGARLPPGADLAQAPRARDRRRSDADGQRRARRSEGGNRGCQVDERARDSSCTACETAPVGRAAGAARQRRRRHAEGHDTSRGMIPILGSKVRGLQATQEASAPCQADPRGATYVGNPTSCQYTRSAPRRDHGRQPHKLPRHPVARERGDRVASGA